jgi:hypothetical protein
MAILHGIRLGPCEILSSISAGEVYRAEGPKVGRAVALKILPSKIACELGHLVAPRIEKD